MVVVVVVGGVVVRVVVGVGVVEVIWCFTSLFNSFTYFLINAFFSIQKY